MSTRELAFKYSTQGAAAAARADERVRRSVQRTGRAAQRNGASVQRWMERNREAIRGLGVAAGAAIGTILAASPTMRAQLGGVRAAFTLFADTIVRDVLPAGESLGSMAVDLANKYKGLPDPIRETISGIVLIGGAILAVLPFIAALISAVSTVAGVISGPVLIAIGLAVAAIGFLALAWKKNVGGIRQKAQRAFTLILDTIRRVIGWFQTQFVPRLKKIAQEAIVTFNFLRQKFSSEIELMKRVAAVLFKIIGIVIRTALNNIVTTVSVFLSILRGDWEGAWQGILRLVSSSIDGITNIVSNVITFLRNNFPIADTLFNQFESAFNTVLSAARSFIDSIISTLNKVPGVNLSFNLPDIPTFQDPQNTGGGGSVNTGTDTSNLIPDLGNIGGGGPLIPAQTPTQGGQQGGGESMTNIERLNINVGERDDPRRQAQDIAREFETELENRGA